MAVRDGSRFQVVRAVLLISASIILDSTQRLALTPNSLLITPYFSLFTVYCSFPSINFGMRRSVLLDSTGVTW